MCGSIVRAMNHDDKKVTAFTVSDESDECDRDAILRRRTTLVQRALGVLVVGAIGAAAEACACLSPVRPPEDARAQDTATDAQGDASPQACLGALPPDANESADASDDAEATG